MAASTYLYSVCTSTTYSTYVGMCYPKSEPKKSEKELRDERSFILNKKEIKKYTFNERKTQAAMNFRNEVHKRFYTTQMNN